ncbi:MAG: hypothetical protein ABSG53_00090 [Thermoguttaceae bacterium]
MDITLPSLLVTSAKSHFRLRCHAVAWSSECGGAVRRYATERDGLVLLSATGADTAVKAVRALLYQPDIEAEFTLELDDTTERLARARYDDKPVSYAAAVAKLATGTVHLVALAKIPGLMPNLSDDHLWAELSGPRYSTPLLRPWTGWLKRAMVESGGIIMTEGYAANAGVLATKQEELDELVSSGVRAGYLRMVA